MMTCRASTTDFRALDEPRASARAAVPHSVRRAFTLTEMLVVVGIIVLLAAIAVPTLSGLTANQNLAGARTMLRSLFASAKARATTKQRYVGVRFQQDRNGQTYAVFLEPALDRGTAEYGNFINGCPNFPNDADLYPDDSAFWRNGNCTYVSFVASSDVQPFKFPQGIEFAEGSTNVDNNGNDDPSGQTGNTRLAGSPNDVTTFTVVFAPTGQVIRKRVFVGERGYIDRATLSAPQNDPALQQWDTVFNHNADDAVGAVPENQRGLLLPDPLAQGREFEISQRTMWVYDRARRISAGQTPFSNYVRVNGTFVVLNPHDGSIVE